MDCNAMEFNVMQLQCNMECTAMYFNATQHTRKKNENNNEQRELHIARIAERNDPRLRHKDCLIINEDDMKRNNERVENATKNVDEE